MKDFKYNRILMIIILIGFVASMAINLERHRVEEANNTVELAIDYEGLVELAEREGVEMPICRCIYEVLYCGMQARDVIPCLMNRAKKDELLEKTWM